MSSKKLSLKNLTIVTSTLMTTVNAAPTDENVIVIEKRSPTSIDASMKSSCVSMLKHGHWENVKLWGWEEIVPRKDNKNLNETITDTFDKRYPFPSWKTDASVDDRKDINKVFLRGY